jgi:hypothetical protein
LGPKPQSERKEKKMAVVKSHVVSKAKKLNCRIEEIGDDIGLYSPAGFKFADGEVHYSSWEMANTPKAVIWLEFMELMRAGLVACDCCVEQEAK